MEEISVLKQIEQIRKIATTGGRYAKSPYDQNRYEELSEIAEQLSKDIFDLDAKSLDPIDQTGYITPKIGVNGILRNQEGEFLLEKRIDDGCWGLPGGWAEVGYSAEENIQRELHEETGFEIEVMRLVGLMSRTPNASFPFTSYHSLFECKIIGGTLQKSHESEEVVWKRFEDINDWHADHKEWVSFYLNDLKG
ncbi:MAG: NUDIX hydrolase N-terminal domain-containing protein [Bacteroidota bacterium]